MQTGWIHDVVRKSKRLKLKQWVWQGIAPREARRWRGGELTAEFHSKMTLSGCKPERSGGFDSSLSALHVLYLLLTRPRGGHLPAQSEKERVQGVRRGGHLPAQSDTCKEPVQGVRRV